MVKKYSISFFLLFTVLQTGAQNKLNLVYERFGKVKSYDLYNGDILDFKKKGSAFFQKNKIAKLQDSTIFFRNGTAVKLDQIKRIRYVSESHLAKTIQDAFVIAGSGFILLNTVNNAIYERSPLIDPAAVYISAGLIGAGLIMKTIRTKNLKVNKNKTLRIIEGDYENLNQKQFN